MKFIFTADWHLSSYSQDKIDNTSELGLPERLSGIRRVIIEIIEYALKNEIKTIVVGGDLFHNKSIIYSTALSVLLDIIRSFPMINFICLDGNHDLSSVSGTGVSALKSLDNESNVKTIHNTTKIENILFVPWHPLNMISDIKQGNTDYLISHFGLNEGSLNSGISIVYDLGLKDLKQYRKVFLGHYHKPQEVGNTIYVGSPIQLDWGEKHEEKRFLIVDTNEHTIDSVLTRQYKKHFEFKLNELNKREIIAEVQTLQKDGHYIKLLRTDDSDLIDIENNFEIIDKREKDITNRGITSGMSIFDKLIRYMEIKGIEKEKIDKYKAVAIDIMSLR